MKNKKSFLIILFIIIVACFVSFYNYTKYNYLVYIESNSDEYLTSGSGIVYKKEGSNYYIVTNYHIIDSSDSITVFNNKKVSSGTIVYYDDYTDIVVIKVNGANLRVKRLNECNYEAGNKVYIRGINGKKSGIIIEKEVVIDVPNTYGNSRYNAIKIESDITYGDSGSAVIDKKGNVIGILSVMDKDSDYAYAIPICDAMDVVHKLENNELYRPNLQATLKNSENSISGILVDKLYDDSVLKKSGIIQGDIITKINNVETNNISEFRNELYKYNINDKILLEYYRNNKYDTLYVILK